MLECAVYWLSLELMWRGRRMEIGLAGFISRLIFRRFNEIP